MDRRGGERIVRTSDGNLRPILLRSCIVYIRQTIATPERPVSDTRHAIANRHTRQTIATIERFGADTCHAIANRHTRQTGATRERRVADTRHAVRNHNTR